MIREYSSAPTTGIKVSMVEVMHFSCMPVQPPNPNPVDELVAQGLLLLVTDPPILRSYSLLLTTTRHIDLPHHGWVQPIDTSSPSVPIQSRKQYIYRQHPKPPDMTHPTFILPLTEPSTTSPNFNFSSISVNIVKRQLQHFLRFFKQNIIR